jgi:KUP system potassium uptake protein
MENPSMNTTNLTPAPEEQSQANLPPAHSAQSHTSHVPDAPHGKYLAYLALGALGVVYGDIGTSPLYAFRESFHEHYGLAVTPENVLGILSLIFWSLLTIISVKYIVFVMRADNRGEGGILAMTSLITPMKRVERKTGRWALILLGIFGTALLYGDGMITPAISVLSALEGLKVATPFFDPYILPITIAILVGLFLFQSRGTDQVGKLFGPWTLLWFIVLAVLGLSWIVREPSVLAAVNPLQGIEFFLRNGWHGFLVLGSVFLVVTGGEALYADMGHFGRRPIRLAWFVVVLPALLLNYFGQGALLLLRPEAVENPFYQMVPSWALYPIVLLATGATVIASQALITGAFSLTMQAVQLGYLPRMRIEHTSATARGQIYIPAVNWALMVACIALVLAFRSSSNLAAAYGVGVTTIMVITAMLLFVVQIERWKWPLPVAVAFTAFFLVIDLAFWGANLVKVPAGGWVPLVVGAIMFTVMTTWKRGRGILRERLRAGSISFAEFASRIKTAPLTQVPGTAIFMNGDPTATPPALRRNVKYNKVLHDVVILLSVVTEEVPQVPPTERAECRKVENDFYQVILHYGFMEDPNVPRDLALVQFEGLNLNPNEAIYFLGRENVLPTADSEMPIWRDKLFIFMSRNASNATEFYRLPDDRVVELGARVEL